MNSFVQFCKIIMIIFLLLPSCVEAYDPSGVQSPSSGEWTFDDEINMICGDKLYGDEPYLARFGLTTPWSSESDCKNNHIQEVCEVILLIKGGEGENIIINYADTCVNNHQFNVNNLLLADEYSDAKKISVRQHYVQNFLDTGNIRVPQNGQTTQLFPLCVYDGTNYNNMLGCFAYDSPLSNKFNDKISSLKIHPGYQVKVYQDWNWGDTCDSYLTKYTSNQSNLGANNNIISTIKVDPYNPYDTKCDGQPPTPATPPTPVVEYPTEDKPVCFYKDMNYGGASKCYTFGQHNISSSFNNSFSSIKVHSGYGVIAYDNPDSESAVSKGYLKNMSDLQDSIDNKISSIKIDTSRNIGALVYMPDAPPVEARKNIIMGKNKAFEDFWRPVLESQKDMSEIITQQKSEDFIAVYKQYQKILGFLAKSSGEMQEIVADIDSVDGNMSALLKSRTTKSLRVMKTSINGARDIFKRINKDQFNRVFKMKSGYLKTQIMNLSAVVDILNIHVRRAMNGGDYTFTEKEKLRFASDHLNAVDGIMKDNVGLWMDQVSQLEKTKGRIKDKLFKWDTADFDRNNRIKYHEKLSNLDSELKTRFNKNIKNYASRITVNKGRGKTFFKNVGKGGALDVLISATNIAVISASGIDNVQGKLLLAKSCISLTTDIISMVPYGYLVAAPLSIINEIGFGLAIQGTDGNGLTSGEGVRVVFDTLTMGLDISGGLGTMVQSAVDGDIKGVRHGMYLQVSTGAQVFGVLESLFTGDDNLLQFSQALATLEGFYQNYTDENGELTNVGMCNSESDFFESLETDFTDNGHFLYDMGKRFDYLDGHWTPTDTGDSSTSVGGICWNSNGCYNSNAIEPYRTYNKNRIDQCGETDTSKPPLFALVGGENRVYGLNFSHVIDREMPYMPAIYTDLDAMNSFQKERITFDASIGGLVPPIEHVMRTTFKKFGVFDLEKFGYLNQDFSWKQRKWIDHDSYDILALDDKQVYWGSHKDEIFLPASPDSNGTYLRVFAGSAGDDVMFGGGRDVFYGGTGKNVFVASSFDKHSNKQMKIPLFTVVGFNPYAPYEYMAMSPSNVNNFIEGHTDMHLWQNTLHRYSANFGEFKYAFDKEYVYGYMEAVYEYMTNEKGLYQSKNAEPMFWSSLDDNGFRDELPNSVKEATFTHSDLNETEKYVATQNFLRYYTPEKLEIEKKGLLYNITTLNLSSCVNTNENADDTRGVYFRKTSYQALNSKILSASYANQDVSGTPTELMNAWKDQRLLPYFISKNSGDNPYSSSASSSNFNRRFAMLKNVNKLETTSKNDYVSLSYTHKDNKLKRSLPITMIDLGDGDDIFRGSTMAEIVSTTGGINNIKTHAGDDTIVLKGVAQINGNGGSGHDILQVKDVHSPKAFITYSTNYLQSLDEFARANVKNIEEIEGGVDVTNIIDVRNANHGMIITGGLMDDDINATNYEDTIYVDDGKNTIKTFEDDDTIYLNGGINNVDGGNGNDDYLLGFEGLSSTFTFIKDTQGSDTLKISTEIDIIEIVLKAKKVTIPHNGHALFISITDESSTVNYPVAFIHSNNDENDLQSIIETISLEQIKEDKTTTNIIQTKINPIISYDGGLDVSFLNGDIEQNLLGLGENVALLQHEIITLYPDITHFKIWSSTQRKSFVANAIKDGNDYHVTFNNFNDSILKLWFKYVGDRPRVYQGKNYEFHTLSYEGEQDIISLNYKRDGWSVYTATNLKDKNIGSPHDEDGLKSVILLQNKILLLYPDIKHFKIWSSAQRKSFVANAIKDGNDYHVTFNNFNGSTLKLWFKYIADRPRVYKGKDYKVYIQSYEGEQDIISLSYKRDGWRSYTSTNVRRVNIDSTL